MKWGSEVILPDPHGSTECFQGSLGPLDDGKTQVTQLARWGFGYVFLELAVAITISRNSSKATWSLVCVIHLGA